MTFASHMLVLLKGAVMSSNDLKASYSHTRSKLIFVVTAKFSQARSLANFQCSGQTQTQTHELIIYAMIYCKKKNNCRQFFMHLSCC